jgi:Na+-driven multidrug efflux pump
VVAGNTAGSNIDGYIYATQNSLYHAALTFVGQNVGARKYERVKKSLFGCALVVTVVGISVGALVICFGRPLLGLFAPGNEAAIDAGMTRLSVLAATYFLCGLMDVASGALRAFGRSLAPMLVSLTGSCLLRILWIVTVFRSISEQWIIYLSYPISWFVTSLVLFLMLTVTLIRFSTQIKRELEPETPILEEND